MTHTRIFYGQQIWQKAADPALAIAKKKKKKNKE